MGIRIGLIILNEISDFWSAHRLFLVGKFLSKTKDILEIGEDIKKIRYSISFYLQVTIFFYKDFEKYCHQ